MLTEDSDFNSLKSGFLIPSLEELSILAAVKASMQHDGIRKFFNQRLSIRCWFEASFTDKKTSQIIEICKSQCQIPDLFKNHFSCAVHWISNQYVRWVYFISGNEQLEKIFKSKGKDLNFYAIDSAVWNLNGTINHELSQLVLLSSAKMTEDKESFVYMFEMASKACLEDEIRLVWSKFSLSEQYNILHDKKYDLSLVFVYYWACLMSGKQQKFLKYVSRCLKNKMNSLYSDVLYRYILEEIGNNANNIGFVISVFVGTLNTVKYFLSKASGVDMEHIIDIYLENLEKGWYVGWRKNPQDVEILFFLLTIINKDIVDRIFNKHLRIILNLCLTYWPWHKFLVPLAKIYPGGIDQVLVLDLMAKILRNLNCGKTDMFLLKSFWKNIPNEVKKSFCLYISVKNENRQIDYFWKNVATTEIMELLLREDECKEILTPYDNFGIHVLIIQQEYEVVNHWLKTCLISQEAIISFLENFIETKSTTMVKEVKHKSLNHVNNFLTWAFKHEDVMNKEKILKTKDDVIEAFCVKLFINGVKLNKLQELKIFIDWSLKNRKWYDDKLINLKIEALKIILKQKGVMCWKQKNFLENFKEFLTYGVKSFKKLKRLVRKIDLHEGENCAIWLEKNDWRVIDAFLRFIREFGWDVMKIKQKILNYIFVKYKKVKNFEDKAYSIGISKLIDWHHEDDLLADVIKKGLEVRNLIIEKYAANIVGKCIYNNYSDAMDNIIECLLKDEDYVKRVLDFKKRVIDRLMKKDLFWQKKKYFLMLVKLINFGKDDKNIKKEIWSIKKYFIETFKVHAKAEIIPKLILGKDKNFVISLFNNEEHEKDFQKILWDLKQFLIKKLIDDKKMFISQLFENLEEFIEFLDWNGFSKNGLKDLKELILKEKGIECCLHWILNDDFRIVKEFVSWCVLDCYIMELKLLKLKENLFENFLCKYSKYWKEQNFPLLNEFLNLYFKEKDTKKDLINKYGVKGCVQKLFNGDVESVKNFMNWAFEGRTNKSINTFKRNLLKEILQDECIDYWDESFYSADDDDDDDGPHCTLYDFHIALDKFLYDYNSPNSSEIANMKFELIEIYFDRVITKLLNERKCESLKNFISWVFNENIRLDEEISDKFRVFKKEIFDKFGKEYCMLMLGEMEWESAVEFWKFCSPPTSQVKKKDLKILLWDFKQDCILQIINNFLRENGDGVLYWRDFWTCLNKFLSWQHKSTKMKEKICEFKNIIRKEYGIKIIKVIFNKISDKIWSKKPKYFLKCLFGVKNDKNKLCLDDNALLNFKKEILENVLNVEFEAVLVTEALYNILEDILTFNTTSETPVTDLKKSVINVQGVQLCIDLICKDNVKSLQKFLQWVISVFDGDVIDFKKAVVIGLTENLTLAYNWESLKSFLDYGFDLNNEQDSVKYMDLKDYVSESCSVDICYNYILKNQWDDVSTFLEWSLEPINNQKLIEIKTRLIKKYGPDYCNARISDNDWEKLEKFLIWSFESHRQNNELEEKISDLKIKTLQKDISYKDRLDIVLQYLEWGFKSKARLNRFKKSILGKAHPLNFLVTSKKYKSQKTVQLWFSSKK